MEIKTEDQIALAESFVAAADEVGYCFDIEDVSIELGDCEKVPSDWRESGYREDEQWGDRTLIIRDRVQARKGARRVTVISANINDSHFLMAII